MLRDSDVRFGDHIGHLPPECHRWWEHFRILVPELAQRVEDLPLLDESGFLSVGGDPANLSGDVSDSWIWVRDDVDTTTLASIARRYADFADHQLAEAYTVVVPGSVLDPAQSTPAQPSSAQFASCAFCKDPNTVHWEEVIEDFYNPADAYCPKWGAPYDMCEICERYFHEDSLLKGPTCVDCNRRFHFWGPWRDGMRIVHAARLFLDSLHLPGDAPCILCCGSGRIRRRV